MAEESIKEEEVRTEDISDFLEGPQKPSNTHNDDQAVMTPNRRKKIN